MRWLIIMAVMVWASAALSQDPRIDPRKRDSLVQSIEKSREKLKASQDSFIHAQDSSFKAMQRVDDQVNNGNGPVPVMGNKGRFESKEEQRVFLLTATGILLLTVLIIGAYRTRKRTKGPS